MTFRKSWEVIKLLAKIKKIKLQTEYKNPKYTVLLECPNGDQLFIKFDYTIKMGGYMPLEVECNGVNKGAKLAWYTQEIEKMTVDVFLETIARKVNTFKQLNK